MLRWPTYEHVEVATQAPLKNGTGMGMRTVLFSSLCAQQSCMLRCRLASLVNFPRGSNRQVSRVLWNHECIASNCNTAFAGPHISHGLVMLRNIHVVPDRMLRLRTGGSLAPAACIISCNTMVDPTRCLSVSDLLHMRYRADGSCNSSFKDDEWT